MSTNSVSNTPKTEFSANHATSITTTKVIEETMHKKIVIKKQVEKVLDDTFEKVTEVTAAPVEKTLLNSVAPLRRICSLPEMINQGDIAAAAALGGLTLVSLPEDCRDLRDAYRNSVAIVSKKHLPQAYNYRKYQHDFSFFRGTLLHEWMKTAKSPRMKKFVNKVYGLDKTLYNTWFGKITKKILGIEDGKKVKSKVKQLDGTPLYVQGIKVKKDYWEIKDLTARAMKRTSILGLVFLGLLEAPKIIKELRKGETTKEKINNGSKQIARGGLNILGISIGMGYGGAWGAKKFGAIGSLIGMGAGLLIGCSATDMLKKIILPEKPRN